jgi:hypothetical protein
MRAPQKTVDKRITPAFRAQAGKGRPKGVPNKATKAVKEMVIQALNEAHKDGGVAYLKDQAAKNPTAFLTLVGKVLPLDVNANLSGAIGLLPASIDDLA